MIDVHNLLRSEIAGHRHLLHEKDYAGYVIDYSDGKLALNKFKFDDCLDLRSGKRKVARYPLRFPGHKPYNELEGVDGLSEDKKESTTCILAVKYRLGSDLRILYFRADIKVE